MEYENFGVFFRTKRIELRLTLRTFAKNKGYDAAYISRLENGFLTPPEDVEKLKALALALEIKEATPDWVTFFDLAAVSRKSIPSNLLEDNPNIINFLPAFFRTARKKEINKEDIKNLLSLLKGEGVKGA